MARTSIDYVPTPKQAMFHATDANEVLYGGAAGGGKLLRVDTPILTESGFVEIGKLNVGDRVFGLDGKPHAVTMVSPTKTHEAWRFTFDDGAQVDCDGEHLWFTYTAQDLSAMTRRTDEFRQERRNKRSSRVSGKKSAAFTASLQERNKRHPPQTKDEPLGAVRTADEIVSTLRTERGRVNHAIPIAAPLSFPERELLLDPYLLGLWLGDGSKNSGGFTGIDGLERAFREGGFSVSDDKNGRAHYVSGLLQVLRKIGVLGNKHIPDPYLFTSAEQRLALLQGLMDTDGNCNTNGTAEFTNTNRLLVDGAAFLIRSLGMKCRITEGRATLNGRDCGAKYRIKFTPTIPVFRMDRKQSRQKTEFRRTLRFRYLVSAERLPPVPMRCIAIDSSDCLYLAGEGLVPTHNSKAIVMDALSRCLRFPETHAYIFRRTYRELEDTIIAEAKSSYPRELASYNGSRHEMRLFNGSFIHFRHCSAVSDMYSYAGAEIHWLYFDELTHFEQEIYDFLKTRLRSKKSLGITPIVRSSSNPGGIGHGWVKALFVDAAPYMQKVEQRVFSKALHKEKITTTQYIPSLAIENPFITEDYIIELEQKPEALRKALLEGNWDAFEGQVFTEWRDVPAHYLDRKFTHVIEPFEVPLTWPRFMSMDHGFSRPFAVLWWAMDRDGRLYLYREWYGCTNRPNTGIGLTPRQIADGIIEREEVEARENISITRIADPSMFDESRGFSTAVQMQPDSGMRIRGVFLEKGDNTRIAGKMQVHERLRFGDDGRPMVQVFNNCHGSIRTMPALPYSPKKPEDVDTDSEDHIYDAWRYVFMANPLPVIGHKPKPAKVFDPFTQGGFK